MCVLRLLFYLQNFDVELDGAQQLRVLAYKAGGDADTLIGKCALEVNRLLHTSVLDSFIGIHNSLSDVVFVIILNKMCGDLKLCGKHSKGCVKILQVD